MKIFSQVRGKKMKFFHRSGVVKKMKIFSKVKKMKIFSQVRGGEKNEIFSQVKKMKIFSQVRKKGNFFTGPGWLKK